MWYSCFFLPTFDSIAVKCGWEKKIKCKNLEVDSENVCCCVVDLEAAAWVGFGKGGISVINI
jgi:hypothetical protein